MTAEYETAVAEDAANVEPTKGMEFPMEIKDICSQLADNDKIIFKSQQIDDPELPRTEKEQLACEVYTKSRVVFLQRFGCYMNERQLNDLERIFTSTPPLPQEKSDELHLLLVNFKHKLQTHRLIVKNRRYVAMQKLINDGEYFSDHEMMQREPELYQELVGQYLSEKEKKQRDGYDVKNTTFSGILMHRLEQQQRDDLMQQVVGDNQECTALVENDPKAIPHAIEDEVPLNCRQQWGGFDDEPVACSSSRVTQETRIVSENRNAINSNRKSVPNLISAGERELLRQEFLGLMHEKFLTGEDKDFDYAAVDDNTQLDDLQQLNQDREDAYFEESDNEAEDDTRRLKSGSESSEDELDIYMQHLSQHHSLQSPPN